MLRDVWQRSLAETASERDTDIVKSEQSRSPPANLTLTKEQFEELQLLRHSVNTATRDRMHALKSDLMSHFNMLGARLGSHLEHQVGASLQQMVKDRIFASEERILGECLKELRSLQKSWSEETLKVMRDASLENDTLQRELSRRVIQSRAKS